MCRDEVERQCKNVTIGADALNFSIFRARRACCGGEEEKAAAAAAAAAGDGGDGLRCWWSW